MKEKACCFIGHREIVETEEIKQVLYRIIESLILNENVDTFLFGSKSQFDALCYDTVTLLKEKYPKNKKDFCKGGISCNKR